VLRRQERLAQLGALGHPLGLSRLNIRQRPRVPPQRKAPRRAALDGTRANARARAELLGGDVVDGEIDDL
jgi:hypothetical protein